MSQYYVAAAVLGDNKQKRAVLLYLTGPAGQEIFDTLSLIQETTMNQ